MLKVLAALLFLLSPALAQIAVTDHYGNEITITDLSRVLSLGGSVTEIIFALGQGDHLVAVDATSLYPPEAVAKLPQVGVFRRISAEGVLALEPTLILTTPGAGPPEALEQLRDAGVTIFIVPREDSIEGTKARIAIIAKIFGVSERVADINRQIDLDVLETRLHLDAVRAASKPRVMFIYARGVGTLNVSGTGTSAHAMITLAGGENAVTEYEGFRPLTAEAAVAAAPDVLLFVTRGLESVGGYEGLSELPGLALTPAYENERIVALDDLFLLGFGPRVGRAVLELNRAFYPELRLGQR